MDEQIPVGAHLVASRLGYLHHGIYVGRGRVVHYAGLSSLRRRGPVEEVTLERFCRGHALRIRPHARPLYSGAAAAARARSRLGEDEYRVLSNNCEHFCDWCIDGQSRTRWAGVLAAPLRYAALLLTPGRAPVLHRS